MRLCLALLVCIKQGSENMVLVVVLQIGAKDFTVSSPWLCHGLLNTWIELPDNLRVNL